MVAFGLLALVLAGFGANLFAEHLIEAKVAHAAQLRLHGATNVDLSGPPALIDLFTGQVPNLQIDSTDASLCRFRGLSVSASLTNVSDNNSELSIGATQATVTIGKAALSGALGSRLRSATITTDPAHDLIDVGAGPGGIVELLIRPVLSASTLSVRLVGVNLLGQPASKLLVDKLRRKIHFSRTLAHLPMDLSPTDVSVTSDGITISLSGGSWQGSATSAPGSQRCA